jgi:hypothetical protein
MAWQTTNAVGFGFRFAQRARGARAVVSAMQEFMRQFMDES